jgi:glycosyltransferase involved in cell wall biosynthesis
LPEIVGDAGIQVNPHSPDELVQRIIDILKNDNLRENLRRKGIQRAKLFSWKNTASKTLDVYKEVFENNNLSS